jgi:hypothetical protein
MKRFLFIVALILASTLSTLAQTILGIKVGESYVEAKKILEERYGYKLVEKNGNLALYDFEMGDIPFQYGTLYFQWSGGTAKFYKAEFQDWTSISDTETLKSKRDYLMKMLKLKYTLFEYKNKQGFKCSEFLGEKVDGVTMHGIVSLRRGRGNDEKERLYLTLTYEPIADFIDEASDL